MFRISDIKKLFFVFLLLNFLTVNAQYHKMPFDTNHYWQQNYGNNQNNVACDYTLKFIKDSSINSKTYKFIKRIYKSCNFYYYAFYLSADTNAFLRDDTILKRVVIFRNNQEYILYNFNKNVGDTAKLYEFNFNSLSTYTIQTKDSIFLGDGLYHKRFLVKNINSTFWVYEGVGGWSGLLTPYFIGLGVGNGLVCFATTQPTLHTIWSQYSSSYPCLIITSNKVYNLNENNTCLFPNPSYDLINIKTEGLYQKNIEVKNVLGQVVYNLQNINTENTELNIKDLPRGMYFVTIHFTGKTSTARFIKN